MKLLCKIFFVLLINLLIFYSCSEQSPMATSQDKPLNEISILKRSTSATTLDKIVAVNQLISATAGGSLNLTAGVDAYLAEQASLPTNEESDE